MALFTAIYLLSVEILHNDVFLFFPYYLIELLLVVGNELLYVLLVLLRLALSDHVCLSFDNHLPSWLLWGHNSAS